MTADVTEPAAGGPVEVRGAVRIPDHELLRVIGRGSYGEVWEARNVMGTPRAVKIVRRHDFDFGRPFERELEGIMRYEPISRSHAGLVQVLHVGMGQDNDYFYYVMELGDPDEADNPIGYVPKTLRSETRRLGALPVEQCVETGIALASGLGHLHRNGLVHRDVKPANIIYVNGAPKLADVGLVAFMSDTRSMVGTEGYLAPDGSGQPRSDIYSLGKVLYECITGLDRQQFPDVPDSWGSSAENRAAFEFMEIVLKAAEGDAARRYKDTDEMLSDLALLKSGKSLRYLRRVETRLKLAGRILTFSALGLSIAGGAWLYERHKRGQVESAEAVARQAQRKTQELLADSLLAEARAVRLSGQAGARTNALEAVRRGLKAGADPVELRSQAASALALTDIGDGSAPRIASEPGHRATWSPDGKFYVFVHAETGLARVVDRVSGEEITRFPTRPEVLDISVGEGARYVAVLYADYSVGLWDRTDGSCRWTKPSKRLTCVPAFSKDGNWVVSTTDEGLTARACAGGEEICFAPGAPAARGIYIAPDSKWLACLSVPTVAADGARSDLGFRIFSGLPGGQPRAEDVAAIRQEVIESDILLEGASISADGRYLAAAVGEDRMRIWEMPSLSQVAWLRGHQRSVRGTAFHPDNSGIFASTSWDGTTQLWDVPTRKQIMIYRLGGERLLLAPGSGELLIRSWDADAIYRAALTAKSALRVLELPAKIPFGLFGGMAFSPDGKLLAAAGDGGVLAWEMDGGRPMVVQEPTKPEQWRDVTFSRDGKSCYFSGREGLFQSRLETNAEGKTVVGTRGKILSGYASFLQWCGDTLAVSGRFNANRKPGVLLMKPDGGQRHLEASINPDHLAASPDGRWLVVSGYPNNGGTLWDLSQDPPPERHIDTASRAAFGFTSDSKTLIAGTDSLVWFYDPLNPDRERAPARSRRDCQTVPAYSCSSAVAGLTAVTTAPDEVTLFDTKTFRTILKLESPLTPFDSVMAFSPDGKKLAMAGGVSRVMLWDLEYIRQELAGMGLDW